MQDMKNLISFASNKEPLQFNKGINFSRPKQKNAKPAFQYLSFPFVEPKSRSCPCALFVSFWLNQAISGLK